MHSLLPTLAATSFLIFSVAANPITDFTSSQKARSTITDCLAQAKVPYSIKGSSNWTALITPYNLRLPYTPAVVTTPNTPDQVSSSVKCAVAYNLKVQPKGGGHSYASFSSGGQDGSLIVDMERFDTISVDQSTKIAKIGSGQRLGNVAQALYAQGARALPHGTCPGVGIAGHALHGGYGYASRKWGLTLDHIVALDVVLANGTQVRANNTSYADIFFAMRGAGDSFGIVTYFYMATEAAPTSVLYFSADLSNSLNNINTITTAFKKMQTFSLTSTLLTKNITYGFYTDSDGSFSISGWCMDCTLSTFKSTVFPAILSPFPSPISPTVTQQTWIQALTAIGAPAALTQPLGSAYKAHDTFYAKSLVVPNSLPLTTAAIRSFWTYALNNQGEGPWFSIFDLYGGPGSQINVPSPSASAYSDRDALFVVQNYGYSSTGGLPFDSGIIGIVEGLNNAVESVQGKNLGGYMNYVDPGLSALQAKSEYYADATYTRLLGIKKVVDPGKVFWNPQSVGNA